MARLEGLGPRVKTDIRFPEIASAVLDDMSRWLGVPKNAMIILGTLKFLAELLPVLPLRRRRAAVEKIEKDFGTVIEAIKRGL